MGIPLSCGPVLNWFPERSMDFGFGQGNEDIYAVGAVLAPIHWARRGRRLELTSRQPRVNLLALKADDPVDLQRRYLPFGNPHINRRWLHQQPLRHLFDIQKGHTI
jgi:hypothetical protein